MVYAVLVPDASSEKVFVSLVQKIRTAGKIDAAHFIKPVNIFSLFQRLFREEPYFLFRVDVEFAGGAQHNGMRLLISIGSVDIWRFRYFHVQFMDMRGGASRKSENHQGTKKRENNLLRNHGYRIRKMSLARTTS